MIVGIGGFGSTGSGAVVDYLREFEECAVSGDFELSFLYDPDGVLDLEQHLVKQPIRYGSGDAAIKNFRKMIYSYDLRRYAKKFLPLQEFYEIAEDYLNDLIEMQWEGGLWTFDRRQVGWVAYWFKYLLSYKLLRVLDVLHMEQPQRFLNHRMYIPVHDERFYQATKKFTDRLIWIICNTEKGIKVLDQPFPANNPRLCFPFFSDTCKAINVMRDPRDVYLISKKFAHGWDMRFTPTHHVEDFIQYFNDQMSLITHNDVEDVLNIQFEDLVYKYDETTEKIKSFLGIKKHVMPKRYFDPDISVVNTQIYLRFPDMERKVKSIERQCKKYLYHFDKSKAVLDKPLWAYKYEVEGK